MADIFFFTDIGSINSPQTEAQAFGAINNDPNFDVYKLENNFAVAENSSAYAITKSLVIMLPDEDFPNRLNVALFPLNSGYTAGFPVKLIIYRGIEKTSLLDTQDKIMEPDSTWATINILNIIKELQDKINVDRGTNDVADANSLGLQFENLSDEILIEKLLFLDSDDFHPIIVPAGCQIGQFVGGSDNEIGVEIILDRIGEEPKLKLLKSSSHIFQISKFSIDNSWTERQKIEQSFINRYKREVVLNYLDIAAFYGACVNQNIKIKGIQNHTEIFPFFFNNKAVYVDIRDERGFSYNHFMEDVDFIKLGMYQNEDATDPVFNEHNYYQDWPILKLSNLQFKKSSRKNIYFKFPILIGSPENLNLISCFTSKIKTNENESNTHHSIIELQDRDGTISLKESKSIKLTNWEYQNNELGANYFLFKKSTIRSEVDRSYYSSIWNSFFSTDMNIVFDDANLQLGNFVVNTYSSINTPPLIDDENGEVYYPHLGIAKDAKNITFFSFKDIRVFEEEGTKEVKTSPFIDTGKFKWNPEAIEIQGTGTEKNVGFLDQITNRTYSLINNFELNGFHFDDPQDIAKKIEFLMYIRNGEIKDLDDFFKSFQAVSFSLEEYEVILNKMNIVVATGIFQDHPLYLKNKNTSVSIYEKFQVIEHEVSLAQPSIIDAGDENFTIELTNIEDQILINDQIIEVTAGIMNE